MKSSNLVASLRNKSHRGMEQLVARRAHNPKVAGSSPAPATIKKVSISADLFLCNLSCLFIKLLIPFYKLPNASFDICFRLVPDHFTKLADICIGTHHITVLHRHKVHLNFFA